MITKFKIYEQSSYSLKRVFENLKPQVDEKTITIRSTDNPDFYIDIYFDKDDYIIYIDKPMRITMLSKKITESENWISVGKKITLKEIEKFINDFNAYQFTRKIVYCDYLYKIIAQQQYNL